MRLMARLGRYHLIRDVRTRGWVMLLVGAFLALELSMPSAKRPPRPRNRPPQS